MQTEYQFEEIHVMGEGLLASGTAILKSCGEGYEGEFFVSGIKLDGHDKWFNRKDISPYNPTLATFVFQVISHKLEQQCKDAELHWLEFEKEMGVC